MPIEAMSGSTPLAMREMQGPQGREQITTVTTKCDKKHNHNQSCPHTVSTTNAPKFGEKGYLLDQEA